MFIIIDKTINKIKQTIDKNYGIEVAENELLQEITDEILIDKIKSAYEYELIFDDNDNVVDVNVTKTLEEYQNEQETVPVVEPIDAEKAAVMEAIIDLSTRMSALENK